MVDFTKNDNRLYAKTRVNQAVTSAESRGDSCLFFPLYMEMESPSSVAYGSCQILVSQADRLRACVR
jgi:hypothetical protein